MAQVIEFLLRKYEALSLNSVQPKTNKQTNTYIQTNIKYTTVVIAITLLRRRGKDGELL
jgi:hypothetical protein